MRNSQVSIKITVTSLPERGKGTCTVDMTFEGRRYHFTSPMSGLLTYRIREQRKAMAGLPNKVQAAWPKYEGTEFVCDRFSDSRKSGPLSYVLFKTGGKFDGHLISLVEERGGKNLTPDRAEVADQVWAHYWYRRTEYNRLREVVDGRLV